MKIIFTLISCCFILSLQGCSSVGYYFDAVNGHLSILADQEAIKDIVQDETTSAALKSKLILATQARDFASSEMLLPDNDSYRYYSDIKRSYVVWNVIATEQFSIEARQWCFLVVGCVSYRGYFNKQDAQAYADELAQQGYDVNVSGAQAYSTLGWMDDPLLNTMIYQSEARLVGIIIHELAHQQVYINNDSSFNEAFATSVEIEGIKRWYKQKPSSDSDQKSNSFEAYIQTKKREVEFKTLLKTTQLKLEQLYSESSFKIAKNQTELKQQIFSDLQQDYVTLKKSWQNYSGYDKWMNQGLNNAHLALLATYYDKVPVFQAILNSVNNDLMQFYRTVSDIGDLPEPQREKRLSDYLHVKTQVVSD